MTLLPFFLFLFTVSLFESFLVTDSIYPAIVGILRNGLVYFQIYYVELHILLLFKLETSYSG